MRTYCIVVFLLMAQVTLLYSGGPRESPPPSAKEVIGTWLGYSEERVEFACIELKEDGTGYVSISYLPDRKPELYRVQGWKLKEWDIQVFIVPVDRTAEEIQFVSVKYLKVCLRVEIKGKDWNRMAILFNEKEFARRASSVKQRIHEENAEKR